ncbi:MAG: bacteriohemerythrin [Promethearchaeota archaeon]|jgi:hemerythrin
MAIFDWEDDLVIGIEKIDKQHQELIRRLDDLAEAVLQKQGKNKISSLMDFMEEYGERHFTDEEKFMTFYEFPGLVGQKKHHERFRETTKKLRNELESQTDMESFASSVQRYLIDWLILHIKSEDRKFGEFVIGKI